MLEAINLITPISEAQGRCLKAGDQVSLSGIVYTARDQAHKRLVESIESGQRLPFELRDSVIYYVGPTPARTGRVIGAAGPTTSGRMDAFSPTLISHGLRGMIGKGYRNQQVVEALRKYGAVHFAAIGGAGALLSKYIVDSELVAYEELGTEAIRKLTFKDFPVIVAYDSFGNTVYK